MKKTTRKFAAFIAAMTLTACAMAPMSMVSYAAAEIKITGLDASVERTFEVYQVFTGEYNSTDGTFSNLKWGSGVSTYDSTSVKPTELVDADVISALGDDARVILGKIVTSTTKACDDVISSGATVTISGLDDGYYIIKDVTNLDNKDDANSAYIVQVAAEAKTTEIAIKKAKPTVDKLVLDEEDDAEAGATDGWGESADHAINETFQFKLVATIPADSNLAFYNDYKLIFNDSMHAGVTFEKIDSVKITSTSLTGDNAKTLANTQYTSTAVDNKAGQTWSLTINDVKSIVNNNTLGTDGAAKAILGSEEITVEVIYSAHLNENAVVDNASRTDGTSSNTNYNKVDLQYSNNPDSTGTGAPDNNNDLGQTTEDYVWVFTYVLNNTKYKIDIAGGNELAGAEFELRLDKEDEKTAIKLIDNNNGTYTVADEDATDATTTLISFNDTDGDAVNNTGKFDIIGLDAGTYYLVETEAPENYNVASPITVTIGATHKEDSATTVDLTLEGLTGDVENKVVDTMNNSLPSTGGIGTTMFVLGGSCLVALSGVYLISKKRAKNESAE